jgi:hypothetical protein
MVWWDLNYRSRCCEIYLCTAIRIHHDLASRRKMHPSDNSITPRTALNLGSMPRSRLSACRLLARLVDSLE